MAMQGAEVLGGQSVVACQSRKEGVLPLLVAPWIVHDPVPPRGYLA